MFTRVDLYTSIHNGLRALLFDLSREAARTDVRQTAAIDSLAAQVDRALAFLDEHSAIEDAHILPVLRTLAPDLEQRLAADHRGLDRLQDEVRTAAGALQAAGPTALLAAKARLAGRINQLIAAHLAHMDREETEANRALWDELADEDLLAIRARIMDGIPPARLVQWADLAAAA